MECYNTQRLRGKEKTHKLPEAQAYKVGGSTWQEEHNVDRIYRLRILLAWGVQFYIGKFVYLILRGRFLRESGNPK